MPLGAYLELAPVAGKPCVDPPYRSDCDPVRLMDGVLVTLAKGPVSASLPEPFDSASLSSPATKLLNLFHIEPDTFSRLGLPSHEEEPCIGVCFRRFDSSSSSDKSNE